MAGYGSGKKNSLKIEEIKQRLIDNGVEVPKNINEYKNIDTKNLEFSWGNDSFRNAMRSKRHNGKSIYEKEQIKELSENIGVLITNIEEFDKIKTSNIKVLCECGDIYITSISRLKLGQRCPKCSLKKANDKKVIKIDYRENFKVVEEDNTKVTLRCECGYNWETTRSNYKLAVRNGLMEGKCVRCNNHSPKWEQEVSYILDKLGINYKKNDRTLKKEMDFYLPDYKKGIELNGNYWHSDINKPKKYHYDKMKLGEVNGIRIYNIFEYEFTLEKMEGYIKTLTGKNDIIYARQCEIKEVEYKEAYDFLEENHFQCYGNCNTKIGLYYDNQLVSIMTFAKSRYNSKYDYELIRYCNKIGKSVVGGFSKLLKRFRKENKGSIISYCDNAKFDGEIYKENGFTKEVESVIGFKWLLPNGKVESRNRSWNKSEEYKNYAKIYNCGTSTWILEDE